MLGHSEKCQLLAGAMWEVQIRWILDERKLPQGAFVRWRNTGLDSLWIEATWVRAKDTFCDRGHMGNVNLLDGWGSKGL
jgi:hypothetical protein